MRGLLCETPKTVRLAICKSRLEEKHVCETSRQGRKRLDSDPVRRLELTIFFMLNKARPSNRQETSLGMIFGPQSRVNSDRPSNCFYEVDRSLQLGSTRMNSALPFPLAVAT
jgi:hypothetical protein